MTVLNRKLCVAPMMDWTDRHCRVFHRLLAPGALLYTEMVTTGALLHGDRERHLAFNPQERPLALQLGGCDPADLAACASMAQDWGYDEVNLNVGCPSDRVQKGRFGACLMLEPALVRDGVAALAGRGPPAAAGAGADVGRPVGVRVPGEAPARQQQRLHAGQPDETTRRRRCRTSSPRCRRRGRRH